MEVDAKTVRTPRPSGAAARLRSLAARALAAARESSRRRAARRELYGLSDWQLRDIGIARADIDALIDGMGAEERRRAEVVPLPPRQRRAEAQDHARAA